jgi:hypothetical protein
VSTKPSGARIGKLVVYTTEVPKFGSFGTLRAPCSPRAKRGRFFNLSVDEDNSMNFLPLTPMREPFAQKGPESEGMIDGTWRKSNTQFLPFIFQIKRYAMVA